MTQLETFEPNPLVPIFWVSLILIWLVFRIKKSFPNASLKTHDLEELRIH